MHFLSFIKSAFNKFVELFWYYWVYYIIWLLVFLTQISNEWSWRDDIFRFTFSKVRLNRKFAFCKVNNVVYMKAFHLWNNPYLNILEWRTWTILWIKVLHSLIQQWHQQQSQPLYFLSEEDSIDPEMSKHHRLLSCFLQPSETR